MSAHTDRNSFHFIFIFIALQNTVNFVYCAPIPQEARVKIPEIREPIYTTFIQTEFSGPINVPTIEKHNIEFEVKDSPNVIPLKLLSNNDFRFRIYQNYRSLLRKKRSTQTKLDKDRFKRQTVHPAEMGTAVANATTQAGGDALARALAHGLASSISAAEALNGGDAMAMAKSLGNSTSMALSNGGGHSFAASESGDTGHAKATAISVGNGQSRAEAGAIGEEIVATAIQTPNPNITNGEDGYFEGHDTSVPGDIFHVPLFGALQKGELFNDHFNDPMPTGKPTEVTTEMPKEEEEGPKMKMMGRTLDAAPDISEELSSTTESPSSLKMNMMGRTLDAAPDISEELSSTTEGHPSLKMNMMGRTLDAAPDISEELSSTTERQPISTLGTGRPNSMFQFGRTMGGDGNDILDSTSTVTKTTKKPRKFKKKTKCCRVWLIMMVQK